MRCCIKKWCGANNADTMNLAQLLGREVRDLGVGQTVNQLDHPFTHRCIR